MTTPDYDQATFKVDGFLPVDQPLMTAHAVEMVKELRELYTAAPAGDPRDRVLKLIEKVVDTAITVQVDHGPGVPLR